MKKGSMKNPIWRAFQSIDRFEKTILLTFSLVSLILIVCLAYFVLAGDDLIGSIYEQRSLPVLNKLIEHQSLHPLEYYLGLKKDIAQHLLLLWSVFAALAVSGLTILHRFFFTDKTLHPIWVIFPCCLVTSFIYLYNVEWKVISIHTFFRAQIVYQIMNGNCPPMDPLFAGETLHYQWGYPWAAAFLSNLLNITPFSSFAWINVLSLGCCLWLLYKISNRLIDDPKINIFSAFFVIYCGTIIGPGIIAKLSRMIPFYTGENRIFPLILKFHNNNGVPLGLVFFLLMVYGTLRLFEKKMMFFYSFLVFIGAACCMFFYAAFGPAILAWTGSIGLWWLLKYKDENFRALGRPLLILCILMTLSIAVASPYLRQISSSGGFLEMEFLNPGILIGNFLNFILPTCAGVCVIFWSRKYLSRNLHLQNLSLLSCLFLASITCYFIFHFPSHVEYKFLLAALLPFGVVTGIAFSHIRHRSRWMALALLGLFALPAIQVIRYHFESSPRTLFDINYMAPYYENGTALESRNPEENAMYHWIRENTSLEACFLDAETKIPVYAQRSLWVAFDTGGTLPGYGMTVPRMKIMHGYDDREFSLRQQVVQNLFGSQRSMTEQEMVTYLMQNRLNVVIRKDNMTFPLDHPQLQEIFASETGQFRIITALQP
jgi:hypothetical protein